MSSTEKMVDNFRAPDGTSEEDGDNRGHNDTQGRRRERESAERGEEERGPSSEKKVPLEELSSRCCKNMVRNVN